MYLFNAPAEGDQNPDNDPSYSGTLGIGDKPAFKKAIRSQRCLIPANFFVEGPTKEKLDKPHVVYLTDRNKQAFCFAGVWDSWVDQEKNLLVNSFAIITTVSNALLQQIPHHRSPVILPKAAEQPWLSNASLEEILSLLKPYDARYMQAYPVAAAIKSPKVNGRELVKKINDRLLTVHS
jgi:putative SOS response-associated peptidase YedK